jgi:Holliday junction DNA helicase RuvA
MISQITGHITHTDPRFVVISANGVGYKVFATAETIATLGGIVGTTAPGMTTLWTHLAVRDDALDLYGFLTLAELTFFEILNTVSGIGPKTALGILNAASVETLSLAIQTNDTSHLTKVSGIGKKNAEKIVRELEGKIDHIIMTTGMRGANQSDADVIEALRALGYRDNEARDALKKIDKALTNTGARVKAALKLLG